MLEPGIILAAVGLSTTIFTGTIIGGVIWGIRLEGRVNMVGQLTSERHATVVDRLTRIEGKIDSQNGKH